MRARLSLAWSLIKKAALLRHPGAFPHGSWQSEGQQQCLQKRLGLSVQESHSIILSFLFILFFVFTAFSGSFPPFQ